MRRLGLGVLYFVTAAITFGGVGDLAVRHLLDVHTRYLTSGGAATVPAETSSLVLNLIHALGGGLVGIGVASFALVHFALRRGQRWAGFAVLAATLASEGSNALGMYAVGSFWYVSLAFIVLTLVGLALAMSSRGLRPSPAT